MRDPAGSGDERPLPAGATRAAAALGLFPKRDSFRGFLGRWLRLMARERERDPSLVLPLGSGSGQSLSRRLFMLLPAFPGNDLTCSAGEMKLRLTGGGLRLPGNIPH